MQSSISYERFWEHLKDNCPEQYNTFLPRVFFFFDEIVKTVTLKIDIFDFHRSGNVLVRRFGFCPPQNPVSGRCFSSRFFRRARTPLDCETAVAGPFNQPRCTYAHVFFSEFFFVSTRFRRTPTAAPFSVFFRFRP